MNIFVLSIKTLPKHKKKRLYHNECDINTFFLNLLTVLIVEILRGLSLNLFRRIFLLQIVQHIDRHFRQIELRLPTPIFSGLRIVDAFGP
jgi:hypothetical protein